MFHLDTLYLTDLTIEHLKTPLGIDTKRPRFGWKIHSTQKNTVQNSFRIQIFQGRTLAADTKLVESSESIEITVPDFEAEPMTEYLVSVSVTDNHGQTASLDSRFETGRMDVGFENDWIEPVQEPTPASMNRGEESMDAAVESKDGERDFHEFRPAQYIRIPFEIRKAVKKARVYATAHGLYRLKVNGISPDDREFAPENTAYNKILLYQTYNITPFLRKGGNVIGITLADGWWAGRVGMTGDCCQYGNTTAVLLDTVIEYTDGTRETIPSNSGISSTEAIVFSDLFVGEKYDARAEKESWFLPEYDDSTWIPVEKKDYDKSHVTGQHHAPIRPVSIFHPARIFTAPNGDTIIDAGQNLAGNTEFTVTAPAGTVITLEHFEQLGKDGNYFRNILGSNKEQTDIYITKEGTQTYRPAFTYHGFRYIRITGWPGEISTRDFRIFALASEMDTIGSFHCSDERLNQLQSNIWWSQVSNTISIPTDCPQREKAGWTGDVMVYAPTLCFNRNADAFLSSWMDNVRLEQLENGAIPMIVPYFTAYSKFLRSALGSDTSCGWGDAVLIVPYRVYEAYGDKRILQDNYDAMKKWVRYIEERATNHHPKDYDSWDEEHKTRSRYLWNTDFHFGDWLIPSLVLGNPDANAMSNTAVATMGIVGPAYYAFSTKYMSRIASILGKEEDAEYYAKLCQKIREAFIEEYVHDDGTIDADFQGIYVIALAMDLVKDETRPKMVEHLVKLIEENDFRLDTGFLSIPFLMDVLCDNGKADVAYKLLFQTSCPSWLYEINAGATTMWESWGAITEDGTVSTYSYNHYAFGCVGEWMYRHLGGLQATSPGYKTFRIEPACDSGLSSVSAAEETPYGRISTFWIKKDGMITLHVEVPANTQAEIVLPDGETVIVGSGTYDFISEIKHL